jgi:hypothetical protein
VGSNRGSQPADPAKSLPARPRKPIGPLNCRALLAPPSSSFFTFTNARAPLVSHTILFFLTFSTSAAGRAALTSLGAHDGTARGELARTPCRATPEPTHPGAGPQGGFPLFAHVGDAKGAVAATAGQPCRHLRLGAQSRGVVATLPSGRLDRCLHPEAEPPRAPHQLSVF